MIAPQCLGDARITLTSVDEFKANVSEGEHICAALCPETDHSILALRGNLRITTQLNHEGLDLYIDQAQSETTMGQGAKDIQD